MTRPSTPVRQGIEAVFPADEFAGRQAKVRTALEARGIDVPKPKNRNRSQKKAKRASAS